MGRNGSKTTRRVSVKIFDSLWVQLTPTLRADLKAHWYRNPKHTISTSTVAHTPTQQQAGPSVHHCKQAEHCGKGSPPDDDLPKAIFRDNWYKLRQMSPAFHPPEDRLVPEASDRGRHAVLHPDDLQLHLQNALQIIKCVDLPTKKSPLSLCSVKGTWHWRVLVSTTSPVNVVWSTTHPPRQTVKSAVADKSLNWFGN